MITLEVNGKLHVIEARPSDRLSDVIRNEIGPRGQK